VLDARSPAKENTMSEAIVSNGKKRPSHEYKSIDWELHDGLLTAAVRVTHTCENTDKKLGWVERFTQVFACEDLPMENVVRGLLTKSPLLIRTQNALRKLPRSQALRHQNGYFLEGMKAEKVELSPEETLQKLVGEGKLTKAQLLAIAAKME
jgi:hypothetical protein